MRRRIRQDATERSPRPARTIRSEAISIRRAWSARQQTQIDCRLFLLFRYLLALLARDRKPDGHSLRPALHLAAGFATFGGAALIAAHFEFDVVARFRRIFPLAFGHGIVSKPLSSQTCPGGARQGTRAALSGKAINNPCDRNRLPGRRRKIALRTRCRGQFAGCGDPGPAAERSRTSVAKLPGRTIDDLRHCLCRGPDRV